jgi:hypothetical protein
MAYNETLAERIRESLTSFNDVKERRMFGGLAFMVNGKMTITVNNRPDHVMMVHIDPLLHEEALKRKGAATAIMRGKEYKGWIFLTEDAITSDEDFDYWISLGSAFNIAEMKT